MTNRQVILNYFDRINIRIIELKDPLALLDETKRDNLTEELRDWMRELKVLVVPVEEW
jgi:hypothetical protein